MSFDRSEPVAANDFRRDHVRLILASYRQLTGRRLIPDDMEDIGQALYDAPCVVLAHDTAADPVFFYANRTAQTLFEMPWKDIVRLPSRRSAEPLAREERQRLLDRVSRHGFIDDYSGVRISRSGQRFLIERATVWNLTDATGKVVGQAASFDHWTPLNC